MTHEQRKTYKNRLYTLRVNTTALNDSLVDGDTVTTAQLKTALFQLEALTGILYEVNDEIPTFG